MDTTDTSLTQGKSTKLKQKNWQPEICFLGVLANQAVKVPWHISKLCIYFWFSRAGHFNKPWSANKLQNFIYIYNTLTNNGSLILKITFIRQDQTYNRIEHLHVYSSVKTVGTFFSLKEKMFVSIISLFFCYIFCLICKQSWAFSWKSWNPSKLQQQQKNLHTIT